MQKTLEFSQCSDKIRALAYCPKLNQLFAGCCHVEVFDLAKQTNISTLKSIAGELGSVYSLYLLNSTSSSGGSGGDLVLCGRHDGTLEMFDLRADSRPISSIKSHTNTIRSISQLSNGRIITGSYDTTCQVYDMRASKFVSLANTYPSLTSHRHSGYVNAISEYITSDRSRLYTASQSGISVFAKKSTSDDYAIDASQTRMDKNGHKDEVLGMARVDIHEQPFIVSCSKDTTLKVYDLFLNKSINTMYGHSSSVTCVCVDQSTYRAFSTDASGMLFQWSLEGFYNEDSIQAHDDPIRALTLVQTNDSMQVATGAQDNTIRLWSVQ